MSGVKSLGYGKLIILLIWYEHLQLLGSIRQCKGRMMSALSSLWQPRPYAIPRISCKLLLSEGVVERGIVDMGWVGIVFDNAKKAKPCWCGLRLQR